MKHRRVWFLALSALVPAASCSTQDDPPAATNLAAGFAGSSSKADSGVDDAGVVDASAGSAGSGGGILLEGGADAEECLSNILCGAAAECCEVGSECVEGRCLPACASGTRCGTDGSVCCEPGQVCLASACVDPGASCNDSYDCGETEFCEPTLDQCLPQPEGAALCEYRPAPLPFEAIVEWSWTGSAIKPEATQIINMPVVVDLDHDDVPEVIVVTSETFDANKPGYLRALDGSTGQEKWPATAGVYAEGNEVNPRGTPAAADIDGDGSVDVVAPRKGGGLIAFNADGSLKWRSTLADGVTPYTEAMASVTVAIAHMDGDDRPEVVAGGVVFDNQGRVRSGQGRGLASSNHNIEDDKANYGGVSIIADVDGDGMQDVVTGKAAWTVDGALIWENGERDGYPAIADFDGDQKPELVVVSYGYVRVHDAATGAVLARVQMPGWGKGGPPTIADFDADGRMEIASANGDAYAVFEYESSPPELSVKWYQPTQDKSSNATGSSVFDFEGDGAAEVVYGDECYFRVYSGKDGTVLLETPSSSGTIHEYPVLVDVDGDNNTEIVVVSNDRNHLIDQYNDCPTYGPGEAPRHGVFVYGDAHDQWVRTRRIWNQHAYHISNINADGTLPLPEPRSWVGPVGLNNYRVSTQGAGVYNAPDLRVDLEISSHTCPTGLELRARVKNEGSLGVAAGVKVAFFLGTSAAGELLGEAATTKTLLPGQSELVTQLFPVENRTPPFEFFVTVDGHAETSSTIDECLEDNNEASAGGIACPVIR